MIDVPHLPSQNPEQNWTLPAGPDGAGIWNSAKLTQDFRGGSPYYFIGTSSAAEGHGPFDDYGPPSKPQNSQWESGGF